MTLVSLFKGDRRSEEALAQAQALQAGLEERNAKQAVTLRIATAATPTRDNAREVDIVQS
jgi:hypothetical protein